MPKPSTLRTAGRRGFLRRALVAGFGLGGAGWLFGCGPAERPPLPTAPPLAPAEAATATASAPQRDLDLAPPAIAVDGLRAVPIDIRQVQARVVFDATARAARAEATVEFIAGGEDGSPIFDLRQEINSAQLDGQPLDLARLRHHDLGGGPGAELRVIEQALAAGSAHQLRLSYAIGAPQAPGADPALTWGDGGRLAWDFWFSDLEPARYLEMWLPANLIYDRFDLRLEIELAGAAPHVLVTNGQSTELNPNRWSIAFSGHTTALSPMLLVLPAEQVESRVASVRLPGRAADLRLELHKPPGGRADLAQVEQMAREYLVFNATHVGPYDHGDRFTAYLWDNQQRSMEYDGATTTSVEALEHELFHSWYGRGVKPASQNDGWLDEAWTMFMTGPDRLRERELGLDRPPVTLSPASPYSRITPTQAYTDGARLFAGLAALLGRDALLASMSRFYQAHRGQRVTTAQLERHLARESGQPEVEAYFERYVRGG